MKNVDWAGIARIGEKRVLDAVHLALNGNPIPAISRATKIPEASLFSIRKHGPFAHKKKKAASSSSF